MKKFIKFMLIMLVVGVLGVSTGAYFVMNEHKINELTSEIEKKDEYINVLNSEIKEMDSYIDDLTSEIEEKDSNIYNMFNKEDYEIKIVHDGKSIIYGRKNSHKLICDTYKIY